MIITITKIITMIAIKMIINDNKNTNDENDNDDNYNNNNTEQHSL